MMHILATDTGHFRSRSVGVFRGKEIIHMAPPADRVPWLIEDLFSWLKTTDEHPLVAACVFHYEFEFIHPFSDGNGRTEAEQETLRGWTKMQPSAFWSCS
jgi:Fic family protein